MPNENFIDYFADSPDTTTLSVSDLFLIVQGGITKKIPSQLIIDLVGGIQTNFTAIGSATDVKLTNPASNYYTVDFTTAGRKLSLMPMNQTDSPKEGAIIFIKNIGSQNFDIYLDDTSTPLITGVPPHRILMLTVTNISTPNGAFQVDVIPVLESSNIARNLNLIGGSLDNAPIGANTPSTAAVTSLVINGGQPITVATTGTHTTNLSGIWASPISRNLNWVKIYNEVCLHLPATLATATISSQIVIDTPLPAEIMPAATIAFPILVRDGGSGADKAGWGTINTTGAMVIGIDSNISAFGGSLQSGIRHDNFIKYQV